MYTYLFWRCTLGDGGGFRQGVILGIPILAAYLQFGGFELIEILFNQMYLKEIWNWHLSTSVGLVMNFEVQVT